MQIIENASVIRQMVLYNVLSSFPFFPVITIIVEVCFIVWEASPIGNSTKSFDAKSFFYLLILKGSVIVCNFIFFRLLNVNR